MGCRQILVSIKIIPLVQLCLRVTLFIGRGKEKWKMETQANFQNKICTVIIIKIRMLNVT